MKAIAAASAPRPEWTSDLTEDQLAIRAAVEEICRPFDDDYWLRKDRDGGFPGGLLSRDRRRRLARHRDADRVRRRRPRHQRGGPDDGDGRRPPAPACRARRRIHMNVFGLHPVVVHGSDEQKRRWLPPIIDGRGQGLLRRDRAEHRAEHAEAEDDGRAQGRPLRGQRPEGLDLDGAGRAARSCCWPGPRRSRR